MVQRTKAKSPKATTKAAVAAAVAVTVSFREAQASTFVDAYLVSLNDNGFLSLQLGDGRMFYIPLDKVYWVRQQ